MLEARNEYGFYGSAGGYTGETPPKASKGGYHYYDYKFKITGERLNEETVIFSAIDYEHAKKQAQNYARKHRPNDGEVKIEYIKFCGQTARTWRDKK